MERRRNCDDDNSKTLRQLAQLAQRQHATETATVMATNHHGNCNNNENKMRR
jgi:hypothetical protein